MVQEAHACKADDSPMQVLGLLEDMGLVEKQRGDVALTQEGIWYQSVIQRAFLPPSILRRVVDHDNKGEN